MAMDSQNYVSQSGDGRWMVVRNGQLQGYFDSQQQAERMYIYLTEGGAPGSAYVPPTPQPTPAPAPNPSPYSPSPSPAPSPGPSSGSGNSGYDLVGGSGQYDQQIRLLQEKYLQDRLGEDRRQFDIQEERLRQQGHLSEQELAERRRQFDAGQAEQTRQFNQTFGEGQRQFDANFGENRRQFDQSQGQQSEQYWAGLLGSLSGPRDWIKYQIAQSQMPESARASGNMNVMDIARNTPAFGAVRADPTNSWEYAWANRGGNGSGGTGGSAGSGEVDPAGNIVPTGMGAPPSGKGRWTSPPDGLGPGPTGTPPPAWGMVGAPTTGYVPPTQTTGASMPVTGWQVGEPTYGTPGSTPLPKASEAGGQGVRAGERTGQPGPWFGNMGPDSLPKEPASVSAPWFGTSTTQPNQISRSLYNRMTPTQRAMQEGEWSAQSIDPADAWDKMRKAFPQGSANTRTRWS